MCKPNFCLPIPVDLFDKVLLVLTVSGNITKRQHLFTLNSCAQVCVLSRKGAVPRMILNAAEAPPNVLPEPYLN